MFMHRYNLSRLSKPCINIKINKKLVKYIIVSVRHMYVHTLLWGLVETVIINCWCDWVNIRQDEILVIHSLVYFFGFLNQTKLAFSIPSFLNSFKRILWSTVSKALPRSTPSVNLLSLNAWNISFTSWIIAWSMGWPAWKPNCLLWRMLFADRKENCNALQEFREAGENWNRFVVRNTGHVTIFKNW